MCRQQGLRAPLRAISKERRVLAGNLEHRRTKGASKAFGIARTKSGARAARYDDNGLMFILPACVTQWTGLCGVGWNFGKSNRCSAIELAERTGDACRAREGAVKERQSVDRAVIHHERRVNGIDPAHRKFLTHRFKPDPVHLVGQPIPGYSIDWRPRAVESLLLVSANNRANTLLHQGYLITPA